MALLSEEDRVAIGARHNGEKLIQAGTTLKDKATGDALAFPAGFMERVGAEIEAVKTMRQDQSVAKADVPAGTSAQAEAFADLKDWVADGIEATDNAYEEDPDTRDRFHQFGAKIGRSVPRLLDRASTLLPLLSEATVAAEIDVWDFGAARLAEGETLINALRSADNQQELSIKNLPEKTHAFYLAKGNLYLDLKRIARRGRRRFAKNPAKAAAYVLDLGTGRKRPRAKAEPQTT